MLARDIKPGMIVRWLNIDSRFDTFIIRVILAVEANNDNTVSIRMYESTSWTLGPHLRSLIHLCDDDIYPNDSTWTVLSDVGDHK